MADLLKTYEIEIQLKVITDEVPVLRQAIGYVME